MGCAGRQLHSRACSRARVNADPAKINNFISFCWPGMWVPVLGLAPSPVRDQRYRHWAQEHLLCFLQECHFRRQRRIATEQAAASVKSDNVNPLLIFAVCVSRQMKLINRGRNVTLSKILTSKSKYLHRCAGSCLLLGVAMCLEHLVPGRSFNPQQRSGCFVPVRGSDGAEGEGSAAAGCTEG